MKTVPTIVNVSREGLSVCGVQINSLLKMPFGAGVVKDLNVVGLTELAAQIKAFVEANKIPASDLVVVLDAETYFAKQLTGETDEKLAGEVQEFVDSVPLASPSSKIFKLGGKYYVVVINRRLYESVRTAFESLGFAVKAVIPELVLGPVGVGSTFDANACRLILKKMAYVMENSFVGVYHADMEGEKYPLTRFVKAFLINLMPKSFRKGFTLIELLVVIGVLSILLVITLVAINPARQFSKANNTARRSDVNSILNAIHQYAADKKGVLPAGITTTAQAISNTGANICASVVTDYLAALPVDPLTNNGASVTDCTVAYATGYTVVKSATNNRVTVAAPDAELSEVIAVTR